MTSRPPSRIARQALALSAFIVIGYGLLLMFVQLGPPGT